MLDYLIEAVLELGQGGYGRLCWMFCRRHSRAVEDVFDAEEARFQQRDRGQGRLVERVVHDVGVA